MTEGDRMAVMPEIRGEYWLNSEPLDRADLSGKVVLVNLWTYTCVDCLRSLPYLKSWWRDFKTSGFVLLGVHFPEFEFEKSPAVIEEAVNEMGVEWPVVLDNDHSISGAFDYPALPATYLVNREGRIVYTHFGEGNYTRTEENIRLLMGKRSKGEPSSFLGLGEHILGGLCFAPTPKLYCGYEKGFLSNPGGYVPDVEAEYSLPQKVGDDSIALEGRFMAGSEFLEAVEPGAAIFVSLHATEVDLVLLAPRDQAVVEVFLDGEAIAGDLRGSDVDEKGEVEIGKPRMYNLMSSEEPVLGTLGVKVKEGACRAYAFTFSGCPD